MIHMLRNPSTVLGVDIGSRFIRMALMRQVHKKMLLERLGEIPVPEGTIDNGSIINPDLLSEVIRDLWKSEGFKERRAVSAIAVQNVLVRTLTLPNMPQHELCTAARYKAAAMMPTPMRETVVQVASWGMPDENDKVEVTVVAARRANVELLESSLKGAGLKPAAIEIPALSCFRVYAPRDGTVGMLDILDSAVSLSIFSGRCLKMCRVLAAGNIRENLHRHSFPNNIHPLRSTDPVPMLNEGRDVFDAGDILLEIRRSMEYYAKQYGPIQLDRLLVSGADPWLADFLDSRLPYKVEPAVMPDVLLPNLAEDRAAYINKNYAVAIGLAARRCC